MLSILIPVYNYSVGKLVEKLMKQCQDLNIAFEVLVYDDGSDEKYKNKNKFLSNIFGVNYLELKDNMGRAKIRNWLAKSGRYENLLFLDCDSKIIKKDFIKTYIAHSDQAEVISGGRVYHKKPPRALSKILHWKYGSKRESRTAKERNKEKIAYFHTNNFMIKRDIISKYQFDEQIKTYGYEDILFAQRLDDIGMRILHIDNPVEHLGLEKSSVFIGKNISAVDNLIQLKKQGKPIDIRLSRIAQKLKDYKLDGFILRYVQKNEVKLMDQLKSKNPKMYNFDLLRLKHYFESDVTK